MNFRLLACAVALTITGTHASRAADFDWPQWQGPDRNAVSKETGLLQEWPKDGPPLVWKIDTLGGGYGAPSIAAGRIFGMSSRGEDETIWALSESGGKELWATRLGKALTEGMPQGKEGAGCTPTVDGERLYVLGLAGDLACLQVNDGKILWQRSLVKDFGGEMPTWRYNESPLVDGDKLICTPGGKEVTMLALDKMTGNPVWKCHVPDGAAAGSANSGSTPTMMQTLPVLVALDADKDKAISVEELKSSPAAFEKLDKDMDGKITEEELRPEADERRGESPARQGGRRRGGGVMRFIPVYSAVDADKNGDIDSTEIKNATAALQKLDANSDGKLTEEEVRPQFGPRRDSGAGYASAIAVEIDGQCQYVQLTAKSVVGVAATDGKLLWRYDRPANRSRINCSTPLVHDGHVFAASAYGAGGGLAKLSKDGSGGFKAEEVWFSKDMENHHGGVVFHDGCLYGANGGNSGGYLVCLDFKTGEVLWNERDPDKRRAPKGSVTLGDGRLYYRTENGTILLIEPNRKEYIERGRFEQPDRSRQPAWSHPVIANGKLYIRDQNVLFCYDVKAPGK